MKTHKQVPEKVASGVRIFVTVLAIFEFLGSGRAWSTSLLVCDSKTCVPREFSCQDFLAAKPKPPYIENIMEIASNIRQQLTRRARAWAESVNKFAVATRQAPKYTQDDFFRGGAIDRHTISIPLSEPIAETNEFMRSTLKKWMDDPSVFDGRFRALVANFSIFFERYVSTQAIVIEEYLKVAEAFSYLASLQREQLRVELEGRLFSEDEAVRFINGVIRGDPKYRASFPDTYGRGTVIPTKRSLGFTTILDAMAAGIYFGGLTVKTESVDGRRMGPHTFLEHDFRHAVLIMDSQAKIFSKFTRGDEFGSASAKELSFEERVHFRQTLKKFSYEHSSIEAKLMEAILFEIHHELALPIHPHYLKRFLEMYFVRSTDNLARFSARLSDKRDFGQAFQTAPSQDDILAACKKIVAFLDQSYASK